MKIRTYLEALRLLHEGKLPKDFNQWHLATCTGWTMGHLGASRRILPPDFDQWHLATNKAKTSVGHIGALAGVLPPWYDQWGLVDIDGWSVAHESALWTRLPADFDFDLWSMKDKHGRTPKDIYEEYKIKHIWS